MSKLLEKYTIKVSKDWSGDWVVKYKLKSRSNWFWNWSTAEFFEFGRMVSCFSDRNCALASAKYLMRFDSIEEFERCQKARVESLRGDEEPVIFN